MLIRTKALKPVSGKVAYMVHADFSDDVRTFDQALQHCRNEILRLFCRFDLERFTCLCTVQILRYCTTIHTHYTYILNTQHVIVVLPSKFPDLMQFPVMPWKLV